MTRMMCGARLGGIRVISLLVFAATLVVLGFCQAAQAQTVLFKVSRYRFTDEKYKKYNLGFQVPGEIEVSSPRLVGGFLDLAAELGGVTMETKGNVTLISDRDISDEPTFERLLFQATAAARFFPLKNWVLSPFLGGGLGYYQYWTYSRFPGAPVRCPTGAPPYSECFEQSERRHTLASGLGEFITAGIHIPFTPSALVDDGNHKFDGVLSIEYRHHLARLDKSRGVDLGGNQILVGIGFRFRRSSQLAGATRPR